MSKRAGFALLAIAVIVGTIIAIYVRREFFFNPLTFHRDQVINLPYKYYRNPLYIEYDFLKPNPNSTFQPTYNRAITTNRSEIEHVIADLRNAPSASITPDHNLFGRAGMAYIFLRQQVFPTPKAPSPILLTVYVYRAQHVIELVQPNGVPPVVRSLPNSLEAILKEEEDRSQPDQ